jgi:hypothetical protein
MLLHRVVEQFVTVERRALALQVEQRAIQLALGLLRVVVLHKELRIPYNT